MVVFIPSDTREDNSEAGIAMATFGLRGIRSVARRYTSLQRTMDRGGRYEPSRPIQLSGRVAGLRAVLLVAASPFRRSRYTYTALDRLRRLV